MNSELQQAWASCSARQAALPAAQGRDGEEAVPHEELLHELEKCLLG